LSDCCDKTPLTPNPSPARGEGRKTDSRNRILNERGSPGLVGLVDLDEKSLDI
jgi:hypothetical protein